MPATSAGMTKKDALGGQVVMAGLVSPSRIYPTWAVFLCATRASPSCDAIHVLLDRAMPGGFVYIVTNKPNDILASRAIYSGAYTNTETASLMASPSGMD
jgi:hypothetical protein